MFYERLLKLINDKNISFYQLERDLGFANGSVKKFANSAPSSNKVVALARYFNVSTDYLLDSSDTTEENFYVPKETARLWSKLNDKMRNHTLAFMRSLISIGVDYYIDTFSVVARHKDPKMDKEINEVFDVDLNELGNIDKLKYNKWTLDPHEQLRQITELKEQLEKDLQNSKVDK